MGKQNTQKGGKGGQQGGHGTGKSGTTHIRR